MHYIAFILTVVALVLWDVNANNARVTAPVAWFAYRVAGGV